MSKIHSFSEILDSYSIILKILLTRDLRLFAWILYAMSKGGLALSIINDYSKPFDTAKHSTIIHKL